MSDHEHDIEDVERDEELLTLLREASATRLDDGAAARIAEGAWQQRAVAARGRGRVLPLTGWPRRLAFLAAAAAGLFAAVLTLDGTESVLAVEGDPVQVWKDGEWKTREKVPFEVTVFTPEGSRRLTLPDGSVVSPQAGSLFRIRTSSTTPSGGWSIRVLSGAVDVDGRSVAVEGGGLRTRCDPGGSRTSIRLTMNGTDEHLSAAPADPVAWVAAGTLVPRVRVLRGSALLELDGSSDEMVLGPEQAATVMRLRNARAHIARLREFTEELLGEVALGTEVLGARPGGSGSMRVFLGGGGANEFQAVNIPAHRVSTAMKGFNTITVFRAYEMAGHDGGPSADLEMDVSIGMTTDTSRVREVRHIRNGNVTAVRTDGTGVRFERNGKVEQFASTEALLLAHPEIKELFGDRLSK